MGRTVAAVEVVVVGPQTVAIGIGAVLVGIVDYRLLFACMGVVARLAGRYVWLGRRLSTPEPAIASGPEITPQPTA
jgi:hypothetical protein